MTEEKPISVICCDCEEKLSDDDMRWNYDCHGDEYDQWICTDCHNQYD